MNPPLVENSVNRSQGWWRYSRLQELGQAETRLLETFARPVLLPATMSSTATIPPDGSEELAAYINELANDPGKEQVVSEIGGAKVQTTNFKRLSNLPLSAVLQFSSLSMEMILYGRGGRRSRSLALGCGTKMVLCGMKLT